jgi:alpha-ketoglutarate-dependent taurine dioxygenase
MTDVGLGTAHRSARVSDIEILPLDSVLGAEIRCGDLRKLDDASFARIRKAWLDHLVLVFRKQELTDDDLLKLGARFGTLDDTPRPQPVNQPGQHRDMKALTVVSNVVENGIPLGALGSGDLVWHTDMSYVDVPPDASVLYSLEIPSKGGETGFNNMYLALETLPGDLRRRIKGVTIKHDATHNSGGFLRSGFEFPSDVRVSPGPKHPAIRTHPETRQDTLYLGRRPYSYVDGLPLKESEELLDTLWAHATKPELAWYHAWSVGDVVLWDNRCTMHRRNAFDERERRIMHRTQIKGTKPYRDPQAKSRPPHPRGRMHKARTS